VKLVRYIPDFEFVFLLTAFGPVDSPTLTTQFCTFVRYFSHILFSILPHSSWYLTIFFTFLCRYWPVLCVILHHLSTYFFNTVKKFSWVKLIRYRTLSFFLIDHLCAYRFATLTTQFYTLLVRYFTLVLYFTIYLYAIQPVSYTLQCRLCPVLLCYCAPSFSNVFSFYTSMYFLWHAVTILITSWPAMRFLSLHVILLIVSCYWYATCFVVENIALKKPTWIGGRNVGW